MRYLFILLASLLVIACEDNPDHITVTVDGSGHLTVKVVDKENNPLENASVIISKGSNIYGKGITDEVGVFTSDKLLQSFYRCQVSAEKNGIVYYDYKNLQIIAGENIHIELKPFNNAGSVILKLYINNYSGKIPASEMEVVLFTSEDYNYYYDSPENIFSNVSIRGKTDINGMVKWNDIPTGSYYVLVHNNETFYIDYYVNVFKGEDRNIEVDLDRWYY